MASLPTATFYVLIAFNGLVFLVSILGLLGACAESKIATIAFAGLDGLLLVIQIVVMVILLLYANGQATVVESLDAEIKAGQVLAEQNLVLSSVTDVEQWMKTQESFSCCGVDFEATYWGGSSDLPGKFLEFLCSFVLLKIVQFGEPSINTMISYLLLYISIITNFQRIQSTTPHVFLEVPKQEAQNKKPKTRSPDI